MASGLQSQRRLWVCAGASGGGHMNQLLRLLDYAARWPAKPAFYLTTVHELADRLADRGRVYVIGEANRSRPFRALRVLLRCARIAVSERPDIVITTGSMPIAMFCLCCKLLRARIVWIDSVANIDRLSLSGRFVLLFADLFLTQWPALASAHSKIEYEGPIL